MRILALAAIVAAGMAAATAQAEYPERWYAGVGVGAGNLNASGSDITGLADAQLDTSNTIYTVRAGYRFNNNLAVELGYYDLGNYAFHGSGVGAVDGTARAKSVGLSLVGIIPIDQFDFYGRIGYARSELKVNASTNLIATPFNSKEKQNEATYGVGAHWNIDRYVGLYIEWMKNDKIKVDGYYFGVDFRF